jgi:hypothetical protein
MQQDFSLTPEQYRQLWDPALEGGYPANHFAFRQVLQAVREGARAATTLSDPISGSPK